MCCRRMSGPNPPRVDRRWFNKVVGFLSLREVVLKMHSTRSHHERGCLDEKDLFKVAYSELGAAGDIVRVARAAVSTSSEAKMCQYLVLSLHMLQRPNWASAWRNQASGSVM